MTPLERAKELKAQSFIAVKEISDAPNYHRVGNASLQRCGTCRHFTDSGRCDLYEFKADAMYTCDSWRPDIEALKKARMGAEETTKEVSATPTAVYAHGPGGLFSPAGLSRKHGVVTADVTPNGSTGKRKKKRKEWVATTKPGDKYRSILNPKVYEALIRKGMSKSQAAAISNAMANRGKKAKETAVTPLEYARSLKHVSHDQKTHGARHGVGGLREFAKKRGYTITDRGENHKGKYRYEIRGGHDKTANMRANNLTSAKKLIRGSHKRDIAAKRREANRKRGGFEVGQVVMPKHGNKLGTNSSFRGRIIRFEGNNIIYKPLNARPGSFADNEFFIPIKDAMASTKETKEPRSTFTVFKDKTGRYRWVAISSTAYRDRDVKMSLSTFAGCPYISTENRLSAV